MSGTSDQDTPRGEQSGRLPSLEEQTPGLDTDVVEQTDADAQAFFGGEGGAVEQGAVGDGQRGDEAGRLPSLEAQTPGLDASTVASTGADAQAFFGDKQDGTGQGATTQGATTDMGAVAEAAGNGEGADEGLPPGGDVRTVYENEREPGEAEPRRDQR